MLIKHTSMNAMVSPPCVSAACLVASSRRGNPYIQHANGNANQDMKTCSVMPIFKANSAEGPTLCHTDHYRTKNQWCTAYKCNNIQLVTDNQ